MPVRDFSSMYKTVNPGDFPRRLTVSFEDERGTQSLVYERVDWTIGGETLGLRYGENPDQAAGLYKLVNGNLVLGGVENIRPGRALVSDVELLQSGKHPSKINITDVDSALGILRYLTDRPCTVIVKHNNPCGVAYGATLAESYTRALLADRVAAFGGAIAVNRPLDKLTAALILESYCEVVAAPEFEEGVLGLFAAKPNVRVMRIADMTRLQDWAGQTYLDFKSLMDGGMIAQWAFVPRARSQADFYPAEAQSKGTEYHIQRQPTEAEYKDCVFGWLVEAGVTSNSVLYVKDEATVGIGTGEQDRVGVAEIARDKAYRKLEDRLSWERWREPFNTLQSPEKRAEIQAEVRALKGGLIGSTMISDAFFPFRDGVEVGLREGVACVVQPGGSLRDWDVIQACNEAGAAMVFTGQRSFRH